MVDQPPMHIEGDEKGGGTRFTRTDGTQIYVNPRAVAYVRAPLKTEHGNATIVFSNGAIQSVQETVEQVIHGIHIDMPTRAIPLTPQEDEDLDPQRGDQ